MGFMMRRAENFVILRRKKIEVSRVPYLFVAGYVSLSLAVVELSTVGLAL
jgi:hypothetical protein